ncbi:MAG: type II secretion system F family protein [Pirellulales bacterium]|nr:type II secretion system F family protein [Pirellulales bacterium]
MLLAAGGIESLIVCVFMLSPAFVITVAVVVMMAYRKHQLAMQRAFIRTMAIAAERKIPLAATARSCAAEPGAWPRQKMLLMARMIESGMPLPEVFARSKGLFPDTAMPVLQIGCQTGTLDKALRLFSAVGNGETRIWGSITAKLLWAVLLLIYSLGVITFYMIKLMPAMERIFDDFEIDLPPLTQIILDATQLNGLIMVIGSWGLLLLSILALYSLLRYSGWINFNLPGTNRFLRRLDMATVLETLALVVKQRQPMAPALATLALTYPKRGIRSRIHRVWMDVQSGGDWCHALNQHGLINSKDEAVLQSASRAGNLAWAMRQMADSQRRRSMYRLQTLVQVTFPPLVIFIGAFFALLVIGLFMPLVKLIHCLT